MANRQPGEIWLPEMTDVFSIEKRSEVMARIRGRGSESTEQALVRAMRGACITGWRRHVTFKLDVPQTGEASDPKGTRVLVTRPDFTFRQQLLIVFIDGCFWHCCPEHFKMPKGNRAFWSAKLTANVLRDRQVTRALRKKGWKVMRIWEHDWKGRGGCSVS